VRHAIKIDLIQKLAHSQGHACAARRLASGTTPTPQRRGTNTTPMRASIDTFDWQPTIAIDSILGEVAVHVEANPGWLHRFLSYCVSKLLHSSGSFPQERSTLHNSGTGYKNSGTGLEQCGA
jgi:hypothetical protein